MRRFNQDNGGVLLYFGPDDAAARVQFDIMYEALLIYQQRNKFYSDNWKRMGWRGMLIRVRERAERLWDAQWDWEEPEQPSPDDALDLINFVAFLIRANRGETTRDGAWW